MAVNTSPLSAGAALSVLTKGWQAQRAGGLTASWMLHGRPGVGKSQIVQQLADDIGALLFDVRLTTIEPQDLRGLPYYDHDAQKTVWYRPEDLPDDPENPSILFLDELTAASPHLQPTVYGLLQERRVGQHKLPANVLVIAAGNMIEDGAVAYEMGTALSDRLIHLHVQANAADWLENYAAPRAIAAAVTAFLRSRPDLLDTTEECLRRGDTIACTPRAWERVSNILESVSDRRARQSMISGTLGDAVAAEFSVVADEIDASVNIEDLIAAHHEDRTTMFPDSLHGLNAVVFGLVGTASAQNINAVIDTMEQIGRLDALRPEPVFKSLPLSELCSFGFELLMRKSIGTELEVGFATSQAYARYSAARREIGLD